jgi:hypothetical protein
LPQSVVNLGNFGGMGLKSAYRTPQRSGRPEGTLFSAPQHKWKPGDDLAGNLRAAVGFALWGAGVSPDIIQAVGDDISRFAGYTPTELSHDLANLI